LLMKTLLTHLFTDGLLLAAVLSLAATGIISAISIPGQHTFLANAQEMASTIDEIDTATTAANTTEGTEILAGIIASLQLQEVVAPEWVTAGYWEIESDMPLFGGANDTDPTVTSFNAIVEMTRFADGTFLHQHTFSGFRQSEILFMSENTTTLNGTMTVVTEEGPTEEVPAYITLQNNLISIFVDPEATDNHFGPTPINGIILTPEHLQQISELLSRTAEEAGAGVTETTTADQQQQDVSSMVTDTIANTTEQ
jgi:hypothetical protein